MNMNMFEGRWPKFKQELLPIIFISTIHIWWCFHFPAYIRLGSPWSTICEVGMSIAGVIAFAFMFSFPEKIAPYLKFDQIDIDLWGYTF